MIKQKTELGRTNRTQGTQKRAETGIILIYGLPGSGKSTLSKKLIKQLKEHQPGCIIHHIDPDLIENKFKEDSAIKGQEQGLDQANKEIQKIEKEKIDKEFDSEAWKQSRNIAFQNLRSIIQRAGAALKQGHPTVIVYEDTLQLRGYRRKFRALARKSQIFYVEIHCELELSQLFGINETRQESKRLDPEILEDLYNKFETDRYPLKLFYSRSLAFLEKSQNEKIEKAFSGNGPEKAFRDFDVLFGQLMKAYLSSSQYFQNLDDLEAGSGAQRASDGGRGSLQTGAEKPNERAELDLYLRRIVGEGVQRCLQQLKDAKKQGGDNKKDVLALIGRIQTAFTKSKKIFLKKSFSQEMKRKRLKDLIPVPNDPNSELIDQIETLGKDLEENTTDQSSEVEATKNLAKEYYELLSCILLSI